jgi:hypothetical protein
MVFLLLLTLRKPQLVAGGLAVCCAKNELCPESLDDRVDRYELFVDRVTLSPTSFRSASWSGLQACLVE